MLPKLGVLNAFSTYVSSSSRNYGLGGKTHINLLNLWWDYQSHHKSRNQRVCFLQLLRQSVIFDVTLRAKHCEEHRLLPCRNWVSISGINHKVTCGRCLQIQDWRFDRTWKKWKKHCTTEFSPIYVVQHLINFINRIYFHLFLMSFNDTLWCQNTIKNRIIQRFKLIALVTRHHWA